jgi:REP element-mobilizing transposase RayT
MALLKSLHLWVSGYICAQSKAMAAKRRSPVGRTKAEAVHDGGSKAGRGQRSSGERAAKLLPFRSGRGGARKGAGRKPKITGRPGVDHRERAPLAKHFPVHVTLKLRGGLPRLRSKREYEALRAAFAAGCARNLAGTFRLCHYAVLNDHLHLLCEAEGRTALARGLQGLLIRIARALNKLWQRRGRVFANRYHDHILKSPREVRNALRYLFGNGRKHAAAGREVRVPQVIDTYTSAPWFDGFRERITVIGLEAVDRKSTRLNSSHNSESRMPSSA